VAPQLGMAITSCPDIAVALVATAAIQGPRPWAFGSAPSALLDTALPPAGRVVNERILKRPAVHQPSMLAQSIDSID
jgi:hypothetical protein